MTENMDIVFLGGLFPKETEKEILENSTGPIQNAANVLQWNIVNGLDANNSTPIKLINSLYIGSYPKLYKKAFISTYNFSHSEGNTDINVGFVNLFGIKQYSRYSRLKPYLETWALDGKQNKVAIGYALTDVFVKSLKYIKKINPSIKTCIIVPDLPQYMNTSDNVSLLYKILKSINIKNINRNLEYVDKFVLLTDEMSKVLGVKDYVVIEGVATDIFDDIKENVDCDFNDSYKYILYTGTLNKKYGVLNLVKAFEKIDNPNYRLVICGSGDSVEEVLQAQKKDRRIIFKGQVSRNDVLNLQKQATVLINPRQNIEEFTKYSFPSKNLEYLSSGTPLIAYKLDGIPDEYDDYIYYVKDNSIDSLRNKIIEVCEKPIIQMKKYGLNAQRFVLKEKNSTVQTQKIIELLRGD